MSEQEQFVRAVAFALEPQIDYPLARRTSIIGEYIAWAMREHGLPLSGMLLFDSNLVSVYILGDMKLPESDVTATRAALSRASEIFSPRIVGFLTDDMGASDGLS